MIIDVHVHLADKDVFSKDFLNHIVDDLDMISNPSLVAAMLDKVLSDTYCDKLITQMDEANIDKSILLMTDFGFEEDMDIESIFEKYIKATEKYPDRFINFFGIDARRDNKYADLFEKGIVKYGVKGLKLYPPCGFDLNDKKLMAYYELCQNAHIPVLTHTGASNSNMYNDYDYINQIQEISTKFPDLKIIMAHLTTEGFSSRVELCQKNRNVYCDVSAFQREINTEQLKDKMKVTFDLIPEQVLFGTDWPLYSMMGKQKKWVDYFENLEYLSDENRERLFHKNYEYMMED